MVVLGGVALAIGVFSFFYPGPGRPFVRGYVGDVGASMLVYALLGLVWRSTARARALAAAAIGVAIEGYQAVGTTPHGVVGEILVGSFPDPWDLAAYAVGLLAALAWERWWAGPRRWWRTTR
jgi:hypothetical protein